MTTLAHTSGPTGVARSLLQLNTSYFQAKVLQSAVELGLFDLLAERPLGAQEIHRRLGLRPRPGLDFLDALAGLGLLERDSAGRYGNHPDAAPFLVSGSPRYLGGSIAQHARLHYHNWASLVDILRGKPTGFQKDFSKDFRTLENVRRLMDHMDAFNGFVADELTKCVNWSRYTSFLDVGGARGNVAAHLVRAHPHLCGGVFDLPAVEPLFNEHMTSLGTGSQVRFTAGDFFTDPFPVSDVVILGHVLHDWPPEAREKLIKRLHQAVTPGGAVLIYDAMLSDERDDARSLLQSLNCAIMREGGSEYTVGECRGYVEGAGFRFQSAARVESLTGDRVLIATKNGNGLV